MGASTWPLPIVNRRRQVKLLFLFPATFTQSKKTFLPNKQKEPQTILKTDGESLFAFQEPNRLSVNSPQSSHTIRSPEETLQISDPCQRNQSFHEVHIYHPMHKTTGNRTKTALLKRQHHLKRESILISLSSNSIDSLS